MPSSGKKTNNLTLTFPESVEECNFYIKFWACFARNSLILKELFLACFARIKF